MAIYDWPRSERPREKLLESGAESLSDAELIALVLGSGIAGSSAVDVTGRLLRQFGSLRKFLNADRDSCLQQLGMGPARYALLCGALELARRHAAGNSPL